MWSSDYLHPDGVFSQLPADVTRKMAGENAGRFYGLIT
jgi:hypothetical protein